MVGAGRILESSEISIGNGIHGDVGFLETNCLSMNPAIIIWKTIGSWDTDIKLGTPHHTPANRSIGILTSRVAGDSETDYVLGQDMGVHVGAPDGVLLRECYAVHTRVELIGAGMALFGPGVNELGLSQDDPTEQEMPQTIPIYRSQLNTANKPELETCALNNVKQQA